LSIGITSKKKHLSSFYVHETVSSELISRTERRMENKPLTRALFTYPALIDLILFMPGIFLKIF
jgi:hypothetical protein